MDDIVGLVNELLPGVEPRYNKHYIGLTYNSQARNFVVFHPKKKFVWAEFKTPGGRGSIKSARRLSSDCWPLQFQIQSISSESSSE